MDFVVVGLGLGALGVLCGLLMLGVLAIRHDRAASRAISPEEATRNFAIAAERREIGRAVLAAGAAVIVATTAALAVSLDDRTGAFLVASTVTVAATGLLYWATLYRRRHPLPSRPRARSRRDASPLAAMDAGLADAAQGNGRLPDLALLGLDLDRTVPTDDPVDGTAGAGAPGADAGAPPGQGERESAATEPDPHVAPNATWSSPTAAPAARENGSAEEAEDPAAAVAVGTPSGHAATRESPGSEREPADDESDER